MDNGKSIVLGSKIPDFSLPDIDGNLVLTDHLLGASAILVAFIRNNCCYVKHIREVLVKLISEYQHYGIKAVGINSTDIKTSPEDRPELMKEDALNYGYTFPYLFDATKLVAQKFKVICTPDFFVYSKDGKLTYHGQMDDSRPENGMPVTGKYLRQALQATLRGENISTISASTGENIIWKNH
ncbi:MAG TPA: thioredoxin family protein [Chitinispirillaceae bacterium]|nr:thioredoxin family protein [Chitinispirillaceae bacterium]